MIFRQRRNHDLSVVGIENEGGGSPDGGIVQVHCGAATASGDVACCGVPYHIW